MDVIHFFQKLVQLDEWSNHLPDEQAESLWQRIRTIIMGRKGQQEE